VYGSAQVTKDPIVITGAIPYTITISDKHVQVGCVQVTKTDLSNWSSGSSGP